MTTTRGPAANGHGGENAPGPPGEADRRLGAEGERISQGLADVLVHRLFAVGLDLHAALTCIEGGIAGDVTAERIHRAIGGLDGAIRDFRGVVLDLHPEGSAVRPGLRALIVEAVERACAPGGARPAITLGHGLETVVDQTVWLQVARLVHRTLTLVPGERMSDAHVAVAADPRPPTRLVLHIEAPAVDLAGVAGRLRALDEHDTDMRGMDVSCQVLPRTPERSRIRLEWPVAAS